MPRIYILTVALQCQFLPQGMNQIPLARECMERMVHRSYQVVWHRLVTSHKVDTAFETRSRLPETQVTILRPCDQLEFSAVHLFIESISCPPQKLSNHIFMASVRIDRVRIDHSPPCPCSSLYAWSSDQIIGPTSVEIDAIDLALKCLDMEHGLGLHLLVPCPWTKRVQYVLYVWVCSAPFLPAPANQTANESAGFCGDRRSHVCPKVSTEHVANHSGSNRWKLIGELYYGNVGCQCNAADRKKRTKSHG